MKNLPKYLSLFIFVSFIFAISSKQVFAATLYLSPASGSFSSNFDVTVSVDPQGSSVAGVDAIIKYDPEKIEAQLIQNGAFEQYLSKEINKTTGTISIRAYNTTTLVSSVASVGKITFKPLVSGSTVSLTFLYTPTAQGAQPAGDDSNIASGGKDVLTGVTGATYTLSGTATANPTPPNQPAPNTGVGATSPAPTPTPKTGALENTLIVLSLSLSLLGVGRILSKNE